jgi:biopolymer transport protein ExbD
MTWKIRHEGSPQSVEGLTTAEVVEGLQDGLWEPTDEVMGPGDREWMAIENHSQLEEVVADLEPPPARVHEDEARLDMNPLIDVALVLLIFFMLITSYVALQKVLEMHYTPQDVEGKITRVDKARLLYDLTIKVKAFEEDGKPVIYVEETKVDPDSLMQELRGYVRKTQKTHVLIDAQNVDWGTVVAIQDAAKGAGIDRAYLLNKKSPAKRAN